MVQWLLQLRLPLQLPCPEPVHTAHLLPHAGYSPLENTATGGGEERKVRCRQAHLRAANVLVFVFIVRQSLFYLDKEWNGVKPSDYNSVVDIPGQDVQSSCAAFHNFLHTDPLLDVENHSGNQIHKNFLCSDK